MFDKEGLYFRHNLIIRLILRDGPVAHQVALVPHREASAEDPLAAVGSISVTIKVDKAKSSVLVQVFRISVKDDVNYPLRCGCEFLRGR